MIEQYRFANSLPFAQCPSELCFNSSGLILAAYSFHISPPKIGTWTFEVGETVFVSLRSDKDTGRARILNLPSFLSSSQSPEESRSDLNESGNISRYIDRYKVEFENGDGNCHVRPARIHKVIAAENAIIICEDTDEYRRLARSQLTSNDYVLEIGSSYGKCTEMIHRHTKGRVIGIDVSQDTIDASRRSYPDIRFEKFDAIQVLAKTIPPCCRQCHLAPLRFL